MRTQPQPDFNWPVLAGVLLFLLAAYVPLLQHIPNGADHYFMIDVGETQIVLNNWGTLHATGYPHYVMLGNLLAGGLRLFGVSPALAAALVSLGWGLLAAGLLYVLAYHLGRNALLAGALTTAYGLTRTIWIHHTIAEIYTFGVVLLLGLLLLALWRGPVGGWGGSPYARVYWLALLGGVAVAHHRALGMAAPALLFAVWGILAAEPRRTPLVLLKALLLGLVGFVPYLYLMARAWMGGAWVYGEPGTLAGLWAQVAGVEASRFIGPPETWAALWANWVQVNQVLALDLTWPGVMLGFAGLVAGVRSTAYQRPAGTLLLVGGVAYGFHVVFYTDILSALIISVTLALAFGWFFGAVLLFRATWAQGAPLVPGHRWAMIIGLGLAWALLAGVLVARNGPFIQTLVTNPAGVEVIEQVRAAPPGSVVMLPWGPLHFAVGYDLAFSADAPDIDLVDHQADYRAAAEAGRLVVPEFVRHRYPPEWWRDQLDGTAVYPQAVGPGLVALNLSPQQADNIPTPISALASQEQVTCAGDVLHLRVMWLSPATLERDLSVFAHLVDADGNVVAQDDRFAPVYGWRPVREWEPGELILDWYTLPNLPAGERLRYGLYSQAADGTFTNVVENELEVLCDAS